MKIWQIWVTMVFVAGSVLGEEQFFSQDIRHGDVRIAWENNLRFGGTAVLQDTVLLDGTVGDKSPSRAMLFSAILPGAGELYSGARLRGFGFLAMEGVSWWLRSHFNTKGEEFENKYKNFANDHWSLRLWLDNFDDQDPETHHIWIRFTDVVVNGVPWEDGLYSSDSVLTAIGGYIDGMTAHKNRDYYENVGKYDQFSKGWDDAYDESGNLLYNDDGELVRETPRRNRYLSIRYDSNQALKVATQISSVIIFNHVISAIDAIIAAKQHNRNKQVSWRFDIQTDYTYEIPIRGIALSCTW